MGLFFVLYSAISIPKPNEAFKAQTTFVYYSGGKDELGTYYDDQNRQSIPLAEMPQTMQDAVVAAENRTFWTDNGLDPKGIVRAAFSNARATPSRVPRPSPSSTSRSSTSRASAATSARPRRPSSRSRSATS